MPRFAQNVTIFFLHYISACNFAIIPSFLAARLPPPKRETGGRMRSTSVPVVFNTPSRKELSTNLRVSSGLSFSSAISVSRSVFFCSVTNFIQSSSTLVAVLTVAIKFSIRSFLLRSYILESTALRMSTRISLSSQLLS